MVSCNVEQKPSSMEICLSLVSSEETCGLSIPRSNMYYSICARWSEQRKGCDKFDLEFVIKQRFAQ